MTIGAKLPLSHGVRAALLAVLIGGTISSRGQGFREDEVECEEAVARLSECCAALNPEQIDCHYYPGGCESEPSFPSIDPQESQCIRGLSCTAIFERGVCERLLERDPLAEDHADTEPPLCP